MSHFPNKIWDGIGPRRLPGQYARSSPEDWDQIVSEVKATQEAIGIQTNWPQRRTESLSLALQAELRALGLQDEILATRRVGLGSRSISIPLPSVTPNGVTTIGLWIPKDTSVITSIDVAYLTSPVSTLGTIVLDIKNGTTLLQDAAAFDLESLIASTPAQVTSLLLAKTTRTLQKNDYIHAEITSNNADASVGVGGVLTITYKTCR